VKHLQTQNQHWTMVNTKSRIGRNWAKYLKLYKIVQILINVQTKYYRKHKLERQSSLYTHSLPITTGSGQTNTHCYSSYLYIRKLPTVRFDLCKSHPMSNIYSYTSLCWPKVSSQSYTSPILRWTGNSPIWGKITALLWVHLYYELYRKTAHSLSKVV